MKEKKNYQNQLIEIINGLDSKKSLFLHSCCGPCSTRALSFLCDYFDITVFYYNPNIEPLEEYEKRKSEQKRFIKEFNHANIDFLDCDYQNEDFKNAVIGLEGEKEGGARCPVCYKLRMKKTALMAKKLGYDYFGTTLTVSPYKHSDWINEIGALLEREIGVKYLYSDFKKQDGYKKSIELSKEYNLYRQDYCGCSYGRDYDKNN